MAKTEVVSQVNDVTRIPFSASIKGELVSESDVRIDGSFDGVIFSKGKVIFGEKADFKGTVYAENVEIQGRIDGEVFVGNSFCLRSTSRFDGVCNVVKISIDSGAYFSAQCNMIAVDEYKKSAAKVFETIKAGKARTADGQKDK